eukprot:2778418-Amphidinium_carterae.2
MFNWGAIADEEDASMSSEEFDNVCDTGAVLDAGGNISHTWAASPPEPEEMVDHGEVVDFSSAGHEQLGIDLSDPAFDFSLAVSGQPKKRGRPQKIREVVREAVADRHVLEHGTNSSVRDCLGVELLQKVPEGFIKLCRSVGEGLSITTDSELLARFFHNGFLLPSSNTRPLLQCVVAAREDPSGLDEDILKLHKDFLEPEKYRIQSTAVRAASLGISENILAPKLRRLACAQHLCEKYVRHTLEHDVATAFSSEEKVLYIESQTFDETPMKTSMQSECLGETYDIASSGAGISGWQVRFNQDLGMASNKDAVVTKILQCRSAFAVVLRTQHGFIQLCGHTISPLIALQRTSGENVKCALQLQSGASRWSDTFSLKTRVSNADGASSNCKADMLMLRERAPGWGLLAIQCEVRKTSNVFKRTLEGFFSHE